MIKTKIKLRKSLKLKKGSSLNLLSNNAKNRKLIIFLKMNLNKIKSTQLKSQTYGAGKPCQLLVNLGKITTFYVS